MMFMGEVLPTATRGWLIPIGSPASCALWKQGCKYTSVQTEMFSLMVRFLFLFLLMALMASLVSSAILVYIAPLVGEALSCSAVHDMLLGYSFMLDWPEFVYLSILMI